MFVCLNHRWTNFYSSLHFLPYLRQSYCQKRRTKFHLEFLPYLYYQNMPTSARIFLYVILWMGLLCLGGGDCFFFTCRSYTTYQTILAVLFPVECFCLYASNVLSFNYYKIHLFSSARFLLLCYWMSADRTDHIHRRCCYQHLLQSSYHNHHRCHRSSMLYRTLQSETDKLGKDAEDRRKRKSCLYQTESQFLCFL